jgi:adenosine deaminase
MTQAIPKVELHIHLDLTASYGAVRALRPQTTLAEYRRDFVAPARCPDLADFLSRTPNHLALQQDARGLTVIVEDLFDQLVRDGVIYAELRFAPLQHASGDLTAEDAVRVVQDATRASIAATGVEARVILCTLRQFSAEQSMETVRLVEAFRPGGIVTAFDLAGPEAGFGLDAHVPAFDYARERDIPFTAHAGEALGPESVEETLDRLAPTRIGHGVRAIENAATVQRLKRDAIHLEICPTCNVQTDMYASYADHPVDALRRAGVSLSISTDCRALCDVSLSQELDRLRTTFGWTDADLHAAARAGLEAAFVDEGTRARLLSSLPPAPPASGAIQTVSGHWVDPLAPQLDQITIDDIAQALANQCRFGGHSRAFYSVAQHSAIMCDIALERGATAGAALATLMHDASEAYLVDLPHPIKHRSGLGPPYRRAEKLMEAAIAERFGLVDVDPALKAIDRSLLATERARFTSADGDWPELRGFDPIDIAIDPWEPERAKAEFLARFERLVTQRTG